MSVGVKPISCCNGAFRCAGAARGQATVGDRALMDRGVGRPSHLEVERHQRVAVFDLIGQQPD